MTIPAESEESLYRFIWKMLENKRCKLLRIGGIANHIHIFVDIHPNVSMSNIAGEIKRVSSLWMKQCGLFPDFEGWGKEYFCFSKSFTDKHMVIEYIKNQKQHHTKLSFEDEIKRILHEEGMEWDDKMLT